MIRTTSLQSPSPAHAASASDSTSSHPEGASTRAAIFTWLCRGLLCRFMRTLPPGNAISRQRHEQAADRMSISPAFRYDTAHMSIPNRIDAGY